MRRAANKPIVGFGPVGWAATAVLATLTCLVLAGVDVQAAFLRGIDAIAGADAVLWYVAHVHLWYGFALHRVEFNLITMLYVIVALRIVPQRVAWWRYALVIGWALVHPLRSWHVLVTGPLTALFSSYASLAFGADVLALGVAELTACVVLVVVTRSRRVFLVALLTTIVLYGYDFLVGPSPLLPFTWHAVLAATLVLWAIGQRKNASDSLACPGCGYDRRAAPSQPCPECGDPGA